VEGDGVPKSGSGVSDGPPETGTDIIALAREDLHGLMDQDQLQAAGYPQGSTRYVRVVQDGSVVAAATFDATQTGFVFLGASSCPGSGIS